MAPYQLFIAYDGTDFQGSQRQGKKRTVQLVLENALRSIGWDESSIQLAGRTDSGVHAIGQVASCSLRWKHSDTDLVNALNARLPDDLAIRNAKLVDEKFHARFHATLRQYCYRISISPFPNPLIERFAWRVWPEPSLQMLQQAAKCFCGLHDFRAFGTPSKKGASTVRQVVESSWHPVPDGLEYTVSANGFLYHMVRRMVQVQMTIAQEKMSLAALEDAIHKGTEITAGLAPAKGLILESVSYDKPVHSLIEYGLEVEDE